MAVLGASALAIALVTLLTLRSGRPETTRSQAHVATQMAIAEHYQRLAAGRAAARLRWLRSPAAKRSRIASQMAFHNLSGSDARRRLAADFESSLRTAAANPAVSVAHAGRVLRYLAPNRALVRTPRGVVQEISTAPLLARTASGLARPVALDLSRRGDAYLPENPLTAVSIAAHSAAGVALAGGLRIAMQGADVSGHTSSADSVFFSEIMTDTDASVSATLHGAELFAVLRSRLSPTQLHYRLTLPSESVARQMPDGAVDVLRNGTVIYRIPRPWARDAQQTPVPVAMTLTGHDLMLTVERPPSELAYPVLVDPEIYGEITNTGEGFAFSQVGPGNMGGGGLTLTASNTHYPYYNGTEWFNSSEARLTWHPPQTAEIIAVEFKGLSFSASAIGEKGQSVAGMYYGLAACGSGTGRNNLETPQSEWIVYGQRGSAPCETRVLMLLQAGYQNERGESNTDGGSISASSVVLTTRWSVSREDSQTEEYGLENEGEKRPRCMRGDPVNCWTGNLAERQTDLSIGGRGPGLAVVRNYNSQAADWRIQQLWLRVDRPL